ncbi:peroxidase 65 [Ricinus communis]|jgi:peroxidase|uniref:Peroxidase n=1 Tax=Ricinus communis TaxID=3988 RepID=B9RB80_RICCO|nr:peroxidase 65 [Ricinus communis]EEF52057.1 Peroxidase 65 precursor, putative [Ricinus communis]|eukprot:XP_002511455.1 peroxidase 65 [Ricinus communis]
MAFPFPILLLLFLSIPISESKLSIDYYKTSCPGFQDIIRETVTTKQSTNPTTAAATLRVFFHDCMVEGCDASVLIASNAFNSAERDADLNHNLPGDAFDVVMRAKLALEVKCPKIVSCADILAQATRDLVLMVGGPFYPVRLGRKDGLISKASHVAGNLPTTNMTMDQMITYFRAKGFDVKEMVALMGAHTIGFSHCKEFADRLYHYNKKTPTDPGLNPKYAAALKTFCSNYTKDPTMSAFNDVLTPGKFDNMYFQNLPRGLGLLRSDNILVKDPRTKPFVELYAANQSAFFADFAHVMEKLSVYQIKTGRKGEVRSRCDQFNSITTKG